MKLSLAMIVKGSKDEALLLDQCLAVAAPHVDEIVLVVTHKDDPKEGKPVKDVGAKYGAKMFDFKWVNDFSAARQLATDKCTGDFYLWLDSDDELEHPEKLKDICTSLPKHIDAVFLTYNYHVADSEWGKFSGVVKTKHYRERIIRNNGAFIWKKRLHETLQETRRTAKVRNDEVTVWHRASEERRDQALDRNITILKQELEEEKTNPDPRTMFYLAACYRDAGNNKLAESLYDMYLQLSGWDEERSQALQMKGKICLEDGRRKEAIDCFLRAIWENPADSLPYTEIARVHMEDQRFDRALLWLEMSLSKTEPEYTSAVLNPLMYTYYPLMLYAEANFQEGKLDKAVNACKKALSFQDDEGTREIYELYKKVQGHMLAATAFTDLATYIDKQGDKEKAKLLLEAVPEDLKDHPIVLRFKKKYVEPVVWPKKSVVIFTGTGVLGEWGPWSLQEGIGGSEEAVIRLSQQLVKQGYKVAVYATPGAQAGHYVGTHKVPSDNPLYVDENGIMDGASVEWRNYWELNNQDIFDIFIAWRSPWFFDADIKARKAYCWMHDVMPKEEFTKDRLKKITKVIVLSQFHRELFPNVSDEQIFVTNNGIDPADFERIEKENIKRDPHKIIYQSSHTRGLSYLLDIWPKVKVAVPDATLWIMYGWNSYIAVNKDNPERMEWMERMQKRIAMLDGVEDLGKVSQDDIVRHTLSAGVWAYPTLFPEINCITAQKAQAGGAVPVINNFAALKETVIAGDAMEFSEWNDNAAQSYTKLLVNMLKDEKDQEATRKAMMPLAREKFAWEVTATNWIKEFEV